MPTESYRVAKTHFKGVLVMPIFLPFQLPPYPVETTIFWLSFSILHNISQIKMATPVQRRAKAVEWIACMHCLMLALFGYMLHSEPTTSYLSP